MIAVATLFADSLNGNLEWTCFGEDVQQEFADSGLTLVQAP